MEKEDIKYIFEDHQTETKVIAKVKLLSFNREGLPFILEESKDNQIIYVPEYWSCEVLESNYFPKSYVKTFPIRTIQKNNNILTTANDDFEENYRIVDKFIQVNGEEIY